MMNNLKIQLFFLGYSSNAPKVRYTNPLKVASFPVTGKLGVHSISAQQQKHCMANCATPATHNCSHMVCHPPWSSSVA
eukprot:7895292-Pyramimonas_sp.AAC.1